MVVLLYSRLEKKKATYSQSVSGAPKKVNGCKVVRGSFLCNREYPRGPCGNFCGSRFFFGNKTVFSLDLFGIEPCAFTTICTTLGAMNAENGAQKSKRHRRPSTVLEDYVQDRVFHDESFITQDEQPVEKSDPEGKYSTYKWSLVQSYPDIVTLIVEQVVVHSKGSKNVDKPIVNSKTSSKRKPQRKRMQGNDT